VDSGDDKWVRREGAPLGTEGIARYTPRSVTALLFGGAP
jgi:hypothetical protein